MTSPHSPPTARDIQRQVKALRTAPPEQATVMVRTRALTL